MHDAVVLQIRLRWRVSFALVHTALLLECERRYVRMRRAELRAAALMVLASAVALAIELPRRAAFARHLRSSAANGSLQRGQQVNTGS